MLGYYSLLLCYSLMASVPVEANLRYPARNATHIANFTSGGSLCGEDW